MLRLDTGESGQLITPLTTQTLHYIGAPNEGTLWPTFTGGRFLTTGVQDVTTGLDVLNVNALNRTGDTATGTILYSAGATFQNGSTLTLQNGSALTANNGSTTAFQNGATVAFQNVGAPFTVVNSTVVSNLNAQYVGGGANTGHGGLINADFVDGLHQTSFSLVDGTRAFTGKVRGVATVAGDNALTLATKGYVDSVAPSLAHVTYDNVNETITGNWMFENYLYVRNSSEEVLRLYGAIQSNGDNIGKVYGYNILEYGPYTYRWVYTRSGIYVPPAIETFNPFTIDTIGWGDTAEMIGMFRCVEDGGGPRDVTLLTLTGAAAGQWMLIFEVHFMLDDTTVAQRIWGSTAKNGIETLGGACLAGSAAVYVVAGGADVQLTNVAAGPSKTMYIRFTGDNVVANYDMFGDDRLAETTFFIRVTRAV